MFTLSASLIYFRVYLKGTWSWLNCEQLIADKCGHRAGSLIMDLEFRLWLPVKPQQTVVWSRFAAEKWESSILLLACCSSARRNTWMLCVVSRLGESAAGDGVSRHLPVSFVDSVPSPPLLPPVAHQHLDLQVADSSHHARSCE